jgi:phage tail-like protein
MAQDIEAYSVDKAYGGFRFRLFMANADGQFTDQHINQSFVKVSGVATESEIVEYMQGTDISVNTSPGRVKYANITLDRVFKGTDDLYKWRRKIERGLTDRRDIKIEMLALDNTTLIRSMILHKAWPCKWNMPDLDAGDSSPAIETIELAIVEVYEEQPES